MNTPPRIPTILGLSILMIGLIAGVFLTVQGPNLNLLTKASPIQAPQNLTIFNLSDTSASIYWSTSDKMPAFIQAGTSPSLGLTFRDERDLNNPQDFKLHFVTLTNLTPNTIYFYKIYSGSSSYPENSTLSFKTASSTVIASNQPLIGTIINSDLNPITEALITLEVPSSPKIAAISKTFGNFILPLSYIQNATQSATLTATDESQSTTLSIQLSPDGETLLPIILGQDQNLSPSPVVSPSAAPIIYDLNNDGVINALDLSIILKNFGSKPKDVVADLNHDGVVNQDDVKLLNTAISQNL